MCGTCKFYLGFFQVAAIGSAGMMVTMTAIYYIYGGLPPTYSMSAGFWIQYLVGWLSIYLTLYIVRVLGRGLFTRWTPKYFFGLIIAVIILYMASGVCFFVPVTKQRMIEYCTWYNQTLKRIPRFLDKFQEQYECCGLNGYRDYKDPNMFGVDYLRRRIVYNDISPSDTEWGEDQEAYRQRLKDDKIVKSPATRQQYYFNVPISCCQHERRVKFKNCGYFVEYEKGDFDKTDVVDENASPVASDPSAMGMIHNDGTRIVGCYEKYEKIMENSVFQLNWLLGILKWGSLFQSFFFFALIWIYRLSLKAMRKNLKESLRRQERGSHFLGDDDDAAIILPIQKDGKSVDKQTDLKNKNTGNEVKPKPLESNISEFFKDDHDSASTLSSIDSKDDKRL